RNGQKIAISLEPFNAKLLESRPLSFWIRATQEARFLYPNIPVESVFPLNELRLVSASPPGDGYVEALISVMSRVVDLAPSELISQGQLETYPQNNGKLPCFQDLLSRPGASNSVK
ncbi:unnamed protein product, partial [Allacma fusca]